MHSNHKSYSELEKMRLKNSMQLNFIGFKESQKKKSIGVISGDFEGQFIDPQVTIKSL